MPIRESERKRYPRNWPEISLLIREGRAGWFCECLGECGKHDGWCLAKHDRPHPVTGSPENCDPENLRAMCNFCHLNYDRDHHRETRAATLAARSA